MKQIKRAAALGFFDGIHIGHAALMRRLTEVCNETGLAATVVTFDMLPQNMLESKSISLINSQEDRVGLIKRMFGIEDIIFLHFDETLAAMPWDKYIDYLAGKYQVRHVIAGSNFRFGKGAGGNSKLLKQRCMENNINCDVISDVIYDGIISSSTYIRELLAEGNIERANAFLGHPHVFTDVVRSGQKLGSKLGIPTINMHFPEGVLVPAHGAYATKVHVEGMTDESGLTGITNIGTRPTVDDTKRVTVETHIPGFTQDLYGSKVRIEFHKFLRPEMKYDGLDELKKQILHDCEATREYFDEKIR